MTANCLLCFCRRNGYIYQYFNQTLFSQELEGYLNISEQNNIVEVNGGSCKDFFEFREVVEPYQYIVDMYLAKYGHSCFYPQKEYRNSTVLINENQLVTCGNIPDPRIQFEVDVATTLRLVFKSNSHNEFGGLKLYIMEIKTSSTHPVR